MSIRKKRALAYIIGVALGDGNLSNPNGRAVRLRITCDTRYPKLIDHISSAIRLILPENKVSIIHRAKSYIDISCYSNAWPELLGWTADDGSKYTQQVSVPLWIKKDKKLSLECLRGLLQTDGSLYVDRGYPMVNFVTVIPTLAKDVMILINTLGFSSNTYKITQSTNRKTRYNIRLSKNVKAFVKKIDFIKN